MIQETSVAALESAPDRTEAVFETISRRGSLGATDWELHNALGCPYTSIQRPRGDLVAAGRVRDSGRRRPTAFGRNAIVWVLS